ncbi:MAG TPA: MFS transporter, partial [Jatrophihabitans sp.]|nr:MFS transporter [Jatrophihabitans sp.]
ITFSSLGDWLGLLANTALAQQLTREQSVATQGAAISGVLLVRLAPDLLFGPFAAAIADKLDRRKTVIAGEITAGLLYASIAIGYNLVWLYVAQFAIEAVGLFTQPAKQVIWVAIVPKRLLATANQISLLSVYGTVPIASAVFALLSSVNRLIGGPHSGYYKGFNAAIVSALLLNTISFVVSATTVFLSRHDIHVVPAEREQEQGVVSLLREGVSFVRRNSLIRGLYVGIIGAFAAGGLTVGVAQLWVATLSAGTAGYSIMFGTVFTGLAIGMLVGPRVLPTYTRTRVFGFAIGAAGVTLLVMSVIRDFILATGLAALVGVFSGMAWIIGYTLIGYEVEDRLRGRTFAFVLSSVRIVLLLTIAVGPVLAGVLGSHAIPVGHHSHFRLSGPGLTLFIGGILALLVSYYATSRATPSSTRLRDLLRGRVVRTGFGSRIDHRGLFLTVEGVDPAATAAYVALLVDAAADRNLVAVDTSEPTDTPTGRSVAQALRAGAAEGGVEPETAALLSAADRAEHVASVVRPALERGAVVVCDRFVLTSLAIHGGGRRSDISRIRAMNSWGTGGLLPDLSVVVRGVPDRADVVPDSGVDSDELDLDAAIATFADEAGTDPDRYLLCDAQAPAELPEPVQQRLTRLIETRASLLAVAEEIDLSVADEITDDDVADAARPSRHG